MTATSRLPAHPGALPACAQYLHLLFRRPSDIPLGWPMFLFCELQHNPSTQPSELSSKSNRASAPRHLSSTVPNPPLTLTSTQPLSFDFGEEWAHRFNDKDIRCLALPLWIVVREELANVRAAQRAQNSICARSLNSISASNPERLQSCSGPLIRTVASET